MQQVSIRGARGGSNELQDLTPAEELHLAPEIPGGTAYNVGQLYSRFAASIRGTANGDTLPDFDHAVELHRFIDAIRQSSEEGQRIAVA
jgi:predicted dehydrogenase